MGEMCSKEVSEHSQSSSVKADDGNPRKKRLVNKPLPKARIPSKGAMNHVGDVSSSEVNGPPAKAQKIAEPLEEETPCILPAGQPSPSRGRTADEVVEDSADEERCTFLPRRPWGRELDGEGGWSRIEWG